MRDASDSALKQCATIAKNGACALYAVDDAIVWKESVAGASK